MIYLLDEPFSINSHSKLMESIIRNHSNTEIRLIGTYPKIKISEIALLLCSLIEEVKPNDIVFCPWAIDANNKIDDLFEELSEKCFVVVAAGNTGELIDKYTPARAYGVHTIGSLNKTGNKASHSNYSQDKEIIWVPGTNYAINGEFRSGTSIAAALYTSFLAEAINKGNAFLIDDMIKKLKDENLKEISIVNN